MATNGAGVGMDMFEEGSADMLATGALVDTDIIDIEGLGIDQQEMIAHLGDLAEGVTQDGGAIVEDKDGLVVIEE